MIVERPKDENLCIMPDHLLAETEHYRLYLGRGENTADAFLCRVVKNQTLNGVAFLEQKTLKRLADLSEDLEQARIAKQGDDGKKIHYDWLFPVCEQSFSATQLNGRRINVLSIRDAELDGFIPFSKLKAEVKVDAKSAAWVLGRFLKLQAFLDEDKKCRDLVFDPDMVLISPKKHRVVYVGWFDELVRKDNRSGPASKNNIYRMFDVIYSWVEKNDEPGEDEFLEWLKKFSGLLSNGFEAHVSYYDFLNRLWGSGYHPFTFNKGGIWNNVANMI